MIMTEHIDMVLISDKRETIAKCHDKVLDIMNNRVLNHSLVNIFNITDS